MNPDPRWRHALAFAMYVVLIYGVIALAFALNGRPPH
jgi:hypothetical protein